MQTPQPEQPNPSIDYLNQIASPVPQKTMNPLVVWVAIAGFLAVIILVITLIATGGTSNKDRMTTIAAELTALQTITSEATENIQGSELRTLNSSLTLVLANVNRDSATAVSAIGATSDEKNKNVIAVNNEVADFKSKLEDARLNAIFDRTYAREMTYYLKTVRTQMANLYSSTKKQPVREFLQTTDQNLSPFVEGFENYNGN